MLDELQTITCSWFLFLFLANKKAKHSLLPAFKRVHLLPSSLLNGPGPVQEALQYLSGGDEARAEDAGFLFSSYFVSVFLEHLFPHNSSFHTSSLPLDLSEVL